MHYAKGTECLSFPVHYVILSLFTFGIWWEARTESHYSELYAIKYFNILLLSVAPDGPAKRSAGRESPAGADGFVILS